MAKRKVSVVDLVDSEDEGPPSPVPIELSSDEEDEDAELQKALQASLQTPQCAAPDPRPPSPALPSSGSLLRNRTLLDEQSNSLDNSIPTITLPELLRKHHPHYSETPSSVLFSTFVVDFAWLKQVMPPKVPHTVVKHWEVGHESEPGGDRPGHFMVHPHLTVVHPPLSGSRGIFHAKVTCVLFERHIRVVVSSANLDRMEWERVHQMVWYQDFPRLNEGQAPVPCEFQEQLVRMVTSWGLQGTFLEQFDFSSTLARLVVSVPGAHEGDDALHVGHLRLRQLTRELYEKSNITPATIVAQSSTVGSLVKNWRDEWVSSLQGNPGHPCELKVLFPSQETVQASQFSECSGYLQLHPPPVRYQAEWLGVLYPWKPARSLPPLLPHSKLICALDRQGAPQWLYVGSHNLSQSAWGRRTRRGLCVFNYEVGVWLTNPPHPTGRWNLPFQWPTTPYSQRIGAESPYTVSSS